MRAWEEILFRIGNLGAQSFSPTDTRGVKEVTRGDQGPGLRHALNLTAEPRVLQQRPWWQKELSEGSVETMTRHLRFLKSGDTGDTGLILG